VTAWTLAPNLQKRVDDVHAVYPNIVVYEVGDLAHQQEQSDHNPDSRGIVHAIDVMTETDTANDGAAARILAWLLSWTDDLQYVIHDRVIYGRDEANGWRGSRYSGSDPHTNHIHVSGKHGSAGENHETGTGYSTTAEAMTPPPLEDDMPTADDVWNADIIPNTAADAKTNPTTKAAFALGDVRTRLINLGGIVAAQSKQIDALTAAVTTMAKSGTSIDTTAVVNAVNAVGQNESDAVATLQAQVTDLQDGLAAAGGALAK